MSIPNYKKKYLDEVRPHLMKKFEFTSIMQVPKIEKITLNIGIGNAKDNKKALQSALEELMLITGQKPVVTTAKKDISNFKIRRGFPVGCKVTLRKDFMYEFLERLCAVALPRTRDFRGLSFKSLECRVLQITFDILIGSFTLLYSIVTCAFPSGPIQFSPLRLAI